MKKFINFMIQPPILLSIPFGMLLGYILTSGLSPADQQKMAEYGLDRSRVITISTIAFFGSATLGCLVAQPFRISQQDFLIQLTKDEMAGFKISEEDKDTLTKGIWEVSEDLRRHDPNFAKEKVIELVRKFEEPSADKQMALQKFQEVMRSN